MADKTKIEWTDATWNPITGCTVVSAGCKNCYAMKLAGGRLSHEPTRQGLTRVTGNGPVWTGEVRFNSASLGQPLSWKRGRKIFVCAHGDLFHESVPVEWIDRVFAVMALSPQHLFQVLTKRAERMRSYFSELSFDRVVESCRGVDGVSVIPRHTMQAIEHHFGKWPESSASFRRIATGPLPNVWLGVSVEDQETADARIPHLLATPAAIRWLSAEPLLGPINLRWAPYVHQATGEAYRQYLDRTGSVNEYEALRQIDWVVVGGESGSKARPMHLDWARGLRDQCHEAGTAFLFKQWGTYFVSRVGEGGNLSEAIPLGADFKNLRIAVPGSDLFLDVPPETGVEQVFAEGNVIAVPSNKLKTGRLLDGVLHDGYPVEVA